jgi:hypothetical protein
MPAPLYHLQQIDPGHITAVMADQLFPHFCDENLLI